MFTTKVTGRCELRCGKDVLFMDFVALRGSDHKILFSNLVKVFGPHATVALHRGKAQVDLAPMKNNN